MMMKLGAQTAIGDLTAVERWLAVVMLVVTATLLGFIVRRAIARPTVRPAATRYIAGFNALYSGGLHIGDDHATLRIVEFGDYECPACARLEPVLQKMRRRFGADLATSFVHYPLSYHPNAVKAANLAECASQASVFPQVNALLFSLRDSLATVDAETIITRVSLLNTAQFRACASRQDTLAQIRRGLALAETLQVRGTPTLILNGLLLRDVPTEQQLDSLLQAGLRARRR
jgi:protein-disulfide isomerase